MVSFQFHVKLSLEEKVVSQNVARGECLSTVKRFKLSQLSEYKGKKNMHIRKVLNQSIKSIKYRQLLPISVSRNDQPTTGPKELKGSGHYW